MKKNICKLNAELIENALAKWIRGTAENFVPESAALDPAFAGMRIYDDPLVGVCAADDEVLLSYRDHEKANLKMIMPGEWLPGAKSVVSVFLPFSERIRERNRIGETVSIEWLHGRIEGQACVVVMAGYLREYMEDLDVDGDSLEENLSERKVVVPTLDDRFKIERTESGDPARTLRSNWSERHVAYAAGLGTFSMPGGIITKRGTAGRLLSVVTTAEIETTPREYRDLYQYCIKCGECERRCPARAIHPDMTKDALRCSDQVDLPKQKYAPYYGCGKCQTGVPCEFSAPGAR